MYARVNVSARARLYFLIDRNVRVVEINGTYVEFAGRMVVTEKRKGPNDASKGKTQIIFYKW